MTHKLVSLIDNVNSTHPHLGYLMAMTIIAIKAEQFLLVISPSGCGKSAVSAVIKRSRKDSLSFLSITRARLADYAEQFTNFKGVVVMDDISGGGGEYERNDTVMAFAMLCHEHYTDKHTMVSNYEITNFHGSAILNVQPVLFADLYASSQWEGLLQDKSLRYYHLFRPSQPQKLPPDINIDWGIDIEKVASEQKYSGKIYDVLLRIAQVQWSDSRALQHLTMLLRATASLDNRIEVTESDYELLNILMRPMALEYYLFTKSEFEKGRMFDSNLCAMLVEFASWPRVDIARIARDYKLRPSTIYRILQNMDGWVKLHGDTSVKPTKKTNEILNKILIKEKKDGKK